jgi:hypothetical protein
MRKGKQKFYVRFGLLRFLPLIVVADAVNEKEGGRERERESERERAAPAHGTKAAMPQKQSSAASLSNGGKKWLLCSSCIL